MKRLLYSLVIYLLVSLPALAQNEGINFQGLARNAAGEVLVNQKISLRLSILLDSESGVVAYVETRQATTNPQGIFAVVLGDANTLTKSTNFSTINWTPAPKLIKVELDPNAGTNFTTMGTSKLQAVPFAFYAYGVDAENVEGILPLGSGGTGVASIADLKTSLGVDQVDNTTDANKPLSAASQAALSTKANTADVTTSLASKVDKVTGKELSTNDYTTAEKAKLAAISGTNTGDQDLSSYATTSQLATKANASDVTTSLASKVDKVTGKGLSSNDFTTAEKTKLAEITGNVAGPTGPQGPIGLTGPVGVQGPIGPVGPAGSDGAVGPQGATGAAGAQGIAGPTGATGAVGPAPTGTGIVTVSSGTLQTPGALTGEVTTSGAGLVTSIATGAVTSDKLLDGTIATADLANSAVTDAKIAAVAGSKISGNITGNAANVTGTVAVGNGGTGATTLTANSVLVGNGTSAVQAVAPGTSGNVLTSNGTTWTSATPAAGLPSSGNTAGDMLYWNGTAWVKVASGANGQTLTFYNSAPVWITTNNQFANTVRSVTGKIWMDRNLGATQVATSMTDTNSYGHYYQWGRNTDGHQLTSSAYSTTTFATDTPGNSNFIGGLDWRTTRNDNLWQGVNGINNPCPTGFRLPTEAEWIAEHATWTINNYDGAFSSRLKLPAPGFRHRDGTGMNRVGTEGSYWSSTSDGGEFSKVLVTRDPALRNIVLHSLQRAYGFSIRCIMN